MSEQADKPQELSGKDVDLAVGGTGKGGTYGESDAKRGEARGKRQEHAGK